LLDDTKDCDDVHKVFLVVPPGVNWDTQRKLDLVKLGFFLGCDDVKDRYIQDRRPVRQLPFLSFRILQPVGRFEGDTHFGVLPESST
jgi:hypothetical protein